MFKIKPSDFPGGPAAKTLSSQFQGSGFDPWWELDGTCYNKEFQCAAEDGKIPLAAAETQRSQINKEKNKG